MLRKPINYLVFTGMCLIIFIVVNLLTGPFIRWFVHLAGVSQIVVFGITGSSFWLFSSALTTLIANISRRFQISGAFVLPFLFCLWLLQFGLLLFELCMATQVRGFSHIATFAAALIFIAELSLYPLFILPRHFIIGNKKAGPQE